MSSRDPNVSITSVIDCTIFPWCLVFPTQMLVIVRYSRGLPSVSLPRSPGAGHAVECAGREPEGPGGGWAVLQGGSREALHWPEGDRSWELRSSLLRKLLSLVFGFVSVMKYWFHNDSTNGLNACVLQPWGVIYFLPVHHVWYCIWWALI